MLNDIHPVMMEQIYPVSKDRKSRLSDYRVIWVYRNYDPRAKILKPPVISTEALEFPVYSILLMTEEVALLDPYFIDRNFIPMYFTWYHSAGTSFSTNIFTVLFAITAQATAH